MSFNLKWKPRTSHGAQALMVKEVVMQAIVDKTTADVERDYKAGVHVRTGNLRNSIGSAKIKALLNKVFAGASYAIWHEIGSRGFAGNSALARAIAKHRGPFRAAVNQAIGGARQRLKGG